jgi:hypothetical protein
MTQDDAQAIVRSLVRSVTDDDSVEEAFWGTPHLEWVLITAVESLPCSDEDSLRALADDRMVITYWVTPVGLFKTVASISDRGGAPSLPSLDTRGWPFPDQVTIIGLEHWERIAKRRPSDSLITTWSFRYPDEKLHLIKGVAVSTRHLGEAGNGGETFARSLAGKVGWRTIDVQRM